MHMPLTTKQERVYSEIKKRIRGGDSPTIDELRKALKFKSLRTVVQYFEVL